MPARPSHVHVACRDAEFAVARLRRAVPSRGEMRVCLRGGSASGSAEPPVREPTDACVRVGCRVTCEGGALEAIPREGQALAAQFHDSMNIHSTGRLRPSSLRVSQYSSRAPDQLPHATFVV